MVDRLRDQPTLGPSFVATHRAPKRPASRPGSTDGTALPLERTAAPVTTPGKRKAVKPSRAPRTPSVGAQTPTIGTHTGGRKRLFPVLPSAPTAVGAATLVIAAAGALTVNGSPAEVPVAASTKLYSPASALSGTSVVLSNHALDSRTEAVSRDSQREALEDAAAEELQAAVEAQAEERNAALAQLAASAEKYAGEIAANAWHLPVSGYRLTATFGQSSSLWANTHTGLDFAAPTGTPAVSVANGTIRSTEYSGAYGNRAIVVLEDGTEIWYCHLNSFTVSPGETVTGGQQIGTVGSTGNSTGPHLHLEVRPGAGDAVDPYAAFIAHGLQP
jgi:murein DD-endopeptidase MepM/ murein hydrolase activator NlpD